MLRLAETYRAALQSAPSVKLPDDALEQVLATTYARARAAYPKTVLLTAEAFAAHLACCRAAVDHRGEVAYAADLYLAAAALEGQEVAVIMFRDSCGPVVLRYLRPFSGISTDDVMQELWQTLLVGENGRAPKLRGYSGSGPLAAFVGITAQRLALMGLRRDNAVARVAARAAAEMAVLATDPDLAIIKVRYQNSLQRAVKLAILALDDRARIIFRMHFIDGLSVGKIAKAYRVSQSTVSRWLAKARESVLSDTRRLLAEELRLSENEFLSLWNVLASDLDLSISRVLGAVG